MIVTKGGLEGGPSLYLRDRRPTFVYNFLSLERSTFAGEDPLPKGKSQVAVKVPPAARLHDVGAAKCCPLDREGVRRPRRLKLIDELDPDVVSLEPISGI
jgi:hypothetical protein